MCFSTTHNKTIDHINVHHHMVPFLLKFTYALWTKIPDSKVHGGQHGVHLGQMDPMLAPLTLLSGITSRVCQNMHFLSASVGRRMWWYIRTHTTGCFWIIVGRDYSAISSCLRTMEQHRYRTIQTCNHVKISIAWLRFQRFLSTYICSPRYLATDLYYILYNSNSNHTAITLIV